MPPHKVSFTIALTCISRILIVRDRLMDAMGFAWRRDSTAVAATRHSIASGKNNLDAVYVTPAGRQAQAAVLLCHGIGETVDRWFPVQQLLAANSVASLLFDYSGYGRSTGHVDWSQFEQDAIAAFQLLERLARPLPLTVLGFSLGSGVAAAVINNIAADRLVLCAAFTSFRDAARAVGIPASLSPLVPPIWHAGNSLRGCSAPVLVVHGEKDGLFPVKMAADLHSLCGPDAELVIVPDTGHNQPFRKPDLSYWGPVIERMMATAPGVPIACHPERP